jgi:tRNA1Val (adenine37-N6)-methyltransferase
MPNPYFKFKQFTIHHDRCAMKTTTDACLFGAWASMEIHHLLVEKKAVNGSTPRILDIGAGSGLLSLMVAQNNNNVKIDAVEIEEEAALQAKQNVQASEWSGQVEVINKNILDHEGNAYDYIITNPPFYENELSSLTPEKNVAHHSSALLLSDLLHIIKKKLKPGAPFFMLFPFKRISELEKSLKRQGLFIQKKVSVRQSEKHAPFRIMIMASAEVPSSTSVYQITIADHQMEYTPAFMELLKDYYLYL